MYRILHTINWETSPRLQSTKHNFMLEQRWWIEQVSAATKGGIRSSYSTNHSMLPSGFGSNLCPSVERATSRSHGALTRQVLPGGQIQWTYRLGPGTIWPSAVQCCSGAIQLWFDQLQSTSRTQIVSLRVRRFVQLDCPHRSISSRSRSPIKQLQSSSDRGRLFRWQLCSRSRRCSYQSKWDGSWTTVLPVHWRWTRESSVRTECWWTVQRRGGSHSMFGRGQRGCGLRQWRDCQPLYGWTIQFVVGSQLEVVRLPLAMPSIHSTGSQCPTIVRWHTWQLASSVTQPNAAASTDQWLSSMQCGHHSWLDHSHVLVHAHIGARWCPPPVDAAYTNIFATQSSQFLIPFGWCFP